MTEQTFQRGLALMAATWPDRKPSADTAEAYWLALSDLHDTAFEAAVMACLKTCTFYPRPAEIRAKAAEVLGASGALPPEGEQAWENMLRMLRHWSPDNGWCAGARLDSEGHIMWGIVGEPNGYYGAPDPLPRLVQDVVVSLGGYAAIKYAKYDELGFLRRDFLAFYASKRERELTYGGPDLLSQPLPERRPALRQGQAA